MAGWPLDDAARAGIERTLGQLREIGEAIGSWTGKADVRQTGVSYHAKFEKRVDVMTIGQRFITMMEHSPGMLADAIERLLLADDERRSSDGAGAPADGLPASGRPEDPSPPAGPSEQS